MQALTAPAGGTPPLIDTESAFGKAVEEIAQGEGSVAIDAERASGFRYSARAYLIQIFRRKGGLHLIDPIALAGSPSITSFNQLFSDTEVVIHASTQDLPCLRDFGLKPTKLFDTELGARIAGLERVGLAPLCESLLDISLAKEHSAVDWSTRPLLPEWLDYAALDVVVLLDLKDRIEAILYENSKLEFALQDFAAILQAPEPRPKSDPWRKTSGMHLIKSRYELAIIRELWKIRDEIARDSDIAPGRLFSDAIVVDVARFKPKSKSDFTSLPSVRFRIKNERLRERVDLWWEVIQKTYLIPESQWPEMRGRGDGATPPARIWKERFPLAHAHLTHARQALGDISQELSIPVENLLTPELARRIAFDDGREIRHDFNGALIDRVATRLRADGARQWQIELCAEPLARALCEERPLPPAEKETPTEEESQPSK